MGYIKIFSGDKILAQSLQQKIESNGIKTVLKNNIQCARYAGLESSNLAVEVFIQEIDFGKANSLIEEFRMSI